VVTASLATNAYSIDANNFGTLANIDHLSGSAGSDTLTGDGANNYLMGAAGADVLAGGLGNDELWGGAGSDRLIADGGNDSLYGNYDRLNGFGDYAADIFEIRTNAGSVRLAISISVWTSSISPPSASIRTGSAHTGPDRRQPPPLSLP
jgi:hypothetical protein